MKLTLVQPNLGFGPDGKEYLRDADGRWCRLVRARSSKRGAKVGLTYRYGREDTTLYEVGPNTTWGGYEAFYQFASWLPDNRGAA